jgi:hypothetical protein
MNDTSRTTTAHHDADEDILKVSDEALEAAVGRSSTPAAFSHNVFPAWLACC